METEAPAQLSPADEKWGGSSAFPGLEESPAPAPSPGVGVPQSNNRPSLSVGTLAGAWGGGHHYPKRLPWPGLGPWEGSKASALGPIFKWMPKNSK